MLISTSGKAKETSKLLYKHLDIIAGYDDFMTTYCNFVLLKSTEATVKL